MNKFYTSLILFISFVFTGLLLFSPVDAATVKGTVYVDKNWNMRYDSSYYNFGDIKHINDTGAYANNVKLVNSNTKKSITTTSDISGNYSFEGVIAGNYTVVLTGYTNQFDVDIDSDGILNESDQDIDGDGLINYSQDFDNDGDGSPNWLDPSPNGPKLSALTNTLFGENPSRKAGISVSNSSIKTVNFGMSPFSSITGFVYSDTNNNGSMDGSFVGGLIPDFTKVIGGNPGIENSEIYIYKDVSGFKPLDYVNNICGKLQYCNIPVYKTDKNGYFQIDSLEPGTYYVFIRKNSANSGTPTQNSIGFFKTKTMIGGLDYSTSNRFGFFSK